MWCRLLGLWSTRLLQPQHPSSRVSRYEEGYAQIGGPAWPLPPLLKGVQIWKAVHNIIFFMHLGNRISFFFLTWPFLSFSLPLVPWFLFSPLLFLLSLLVPLSFLLLQQLHLARWPHRLMVWGWARRYSFPSHIFSHPLLSLVSVWSLWRASMCLC